MQLIMNNFSFLISSQKRIIFGEKRKGNHVCLVTFLIKYHSSGEFNYIVDDGVR